MLPTLLMLQVVPEAGAELVLMRSSVHTARNDSTHAKVDGRARLYQKDLQHAQHERQEQASGALCG